MGHKLIMVAELGGATYVGPPLTVDRVEDWVARGMRRYYYPVGELVS